MFPLRYKNQKELILNGFIPLFKNQSDLFDFACADGEWTYMLAQHVKHVDGYEYSQKMVDMANMKYLHGNMRDRLSFSQADIFNFQVEKIYDGGACLGLLTCLSENEHDAVEKLWKMIKPNGYLVTKDTLDISFEYPLYHFNINNGYSATYHDIENYAKLFLDAGFKLCHDVVLDKVRQENIDFISWGGCLGKDGLNNKVNTNSNLHRCYYGGNNEELYDRNFRSSVICDSRFI